MSDHTDTLTEAISLIDQIYTKAELENEEQYPQAPDKNHPNYFELSNRFLEQIALNTVPKIGERSLMVMNKPTHEIFFQPWQTDKLQNIIAVTILTG